MAWQAERNLAGLLEAYPRLDDDDVREALAYYDVHREELDERIRAQLADA